MPLRLPLQQPVEECEALPSAAVTENYGGRPLGEPLGNTDAEAVSKAEAQGGAEGKAERLLRGGKALPLPEAGAPLLCRGVAEGDAEGSGEREGCARAGARESRRESARACG